VQDLKRKDFITATPFSEAQVCGPELMEEFAAVCRGMGALMGFLTRATGFAW
jgi:hypothetical protein